MSGISGLNKVFQTDFTNVSGNCLQACVASILNCEISDVPNFVTFENWKEEYIRFWDKQGKIVVFGHTISNDVLERFVRKIPYSGYCIMVCNSFNHPGKLHAVVGLLSDQYLSLVHDPNPMNAARTPDEYECGGIDLFF